MEENPKIKKYRFIKFIGIIIFSIGIVFLFTSVMAMMLNGVGNLTTIVLGLILSFIGNTTRLVGKNNLDKIINLK